MVKRPGSPVVLRTGRSRSDIAVLMKSSIVCPGASHVWPCPTKTHDPLASSCVGMFFLEVDGRAGVVERTQLRSAAGDAEVVHGHGPGFPMGLQVKCVVQQRLQHRPEHRRAARIASGLCVDRESFGRGPGGRAGDRQECPELVGLAIRELRIGHANQAIVANERRAVDVQATGRRRRPCAAAASHRRRRFGSAGLDRRRFESRRVARDLQVVRRRDHADR